MPAVSFSGLASGIDGDAVIKALMDARRLSSVPLQNKLDENEKESSALEELNTKLLGLSDQLKDFLTLSGGALTKTATSSNVEALGVVAGNASNISNATVSITSIAKSATFSFSDRLSSFVEPLAPGLSSAEQISFSVGTGDKALTFTADVDSSTTLAQLSDQINLRSEGKLKSSVVNVGSESAPQYLLLVNGAVTGEQQGALSVSVSDAIKAQGIFNEYSLEQAKDAVFTVAGIGEVRRSSNQVSDLLPGITLELKKDNSGPVNIKVATDAEKSAAKVADIVKSLNEVITYSKENSAIEQVENKNGITNSFKSLAKSRVDDQAIQGIRSIVSSVVSSKSETAVRVLADLGITTERDGTYKFEQAKFIDAVSKDSVSVGEMLGSFADQLATTDGLIPQYTRFQGNIDLSVDANKRESQSLSDRLAQIEKNLAAQEATLKQMFTNLEKKVSKLNSGASSLTSILASISTRK